MPILAAWFPTTAVPVTPPATRRLETRMVCPDLRVHLHCPVFNANTAMGPELVS